MGSVGSAAEATSISEACDAYAAHSHAEEGQGTGTPDAVDATGEQVGELHAKGMAATQTTQSRGSFSTSLRSAGMYKCISGKR